MRADHCAAMLTLFGWAMTTGVAGAQAPAALDMDAVALACAPGVTFDGTAPTSPRILGSDEGARQTLYGPGDTLVVGGGSSSGIKPGDEFFVRRRGRRLEQSPRVNGVFPIHVATAGWIRIVDVAADHALAAVEHACDGILLGDYLEPFGMPRVPESAPLAGDADYETRGRVLFGVEGKLIGGNREFLVVDIGTDRGLAPGQRLTVFRQQYGTSGPVMRIGHATALSVAATTAVIRVDTAQDAVYAGDFIAVHR